MIYSLWHGPYLELVLPGAGCLHPRPCRPATSWGHPGWWRAGCLPSGKKGRAPDTAGRGHQRGRSQSKPVRGSEDRVLTCQGLCQMLADRHSHTCRHAPTPLIIRGLTTVCLCGAGLIWELGMSRNVRVPCICCWWRRQKNKETNKIRIPQNNMINSISIVSSLCFWMLRQQWYHQIGANSFVHNSKCKIANMCKTFKKRQ